MNIQSKLDYLFTASSIILFDDSSKFVFFSDLHLGIGDEADDFSKNANLFYIVLHDYLSRGFKIILLGDIWELWENRIFKNIAMTYPTISPILIKSDRVSGNHDKALGSPDGLVLLNSQNKKKIFLNHGNPGDFFNDTAWWVGRWFTRYIWRNLQVLGVKDPFSASMNTKRHEYVRGELMDWANSRKIDLICGHTHLAENEGFYHNCGSWVGEGGSGIEIVNDSINLKYFS